jgi:NADH-quinone oxidoreductase subunit L
MLRVLWLVPAVPLLGFVVLALGGRRLPRRAVAAMGTGTVAASLALCLIAAAGFLRSPAEPFRQPLWTWIDAGGLEATIALRLDALSLVMALVVTFVGSLIHLYSVEYMAGDEGYPRFFAYMNLFVGAMLTLVLADDLLLLYLGWEGVGLCSYLLIGFWYREPENGRAARKAFIVTRVGDASMALGILLLFTQLHTLRIDELMARAAAAWPAGSALPIAAAALLLGGAVGKSAQLPLQTWLPDAMAGPTPVSALIHAATMVTAGVYLIARTHALFELAPLVMSAVAVVGAATLLLAGFSALAQRDLKRVLAYSTISQIGYMFLALGVGAWTAAIFHFLTHAFFKALLFLAAGAVILALHHEQDMSRMGGLRAQLPGAFWTFLAGAASLAGLPLATAGFYSKDLILWRAYASPGGSGWLLAAGLLGSLLTALYAFRMVFLVFFGPARGHVVRRPGIAIGSSTAVLAVLAIVAGFVEMPPIFTDRPLLSELLRPVLPSAPAHAGGAGAEGAVLLAGGLLSLLGIGLAWWFHLRDRPLTSRIASSPAGAALRRFWLGGWGFDSLYDLILVRPYAWLARADRDDVIDLAYVALSRAVGALGRALSATVSGVLRWYAAAIAVGAVVFLVLVLFG